MKLLVCGGRNYADKQHLFATLDAAHRKRPITQLIHGAARGADSLAGEWCLFRGIPEIAVPAEWDKYGKRAGSIRNEVMLAMNPDGVIAFPGGSGTAHMVRIAKAAGVTVWEPKPTALSL